MVKTCIFAFLICGKNSVSQVGKNAFYDGRVAPKRHARNRTSIVARGNCIHILGGRKIEKKH